MRRSHVIKALNAHSLAWSHALMHLKMSSAEVVCWKYLPSITDELSIEANSVNQEQTAPVGAVWSGFTLLAIEAS